MILGLNSAPSGRASARRERVPKSPKLEAKPVAPSGSDLVSKNQNYIFLPCLKDLLTKASVRGWFKSISRTKAPNAAPEGSILISINSNAPPVDENSFTIQYTEMADFRKPKLKKVLKQLVALQKPLWTRLECG